MNLFLIITLCIAIATQIAALLSNETLHKYYKVLGADDDTDLSELKGKYHILALKYHPDKHKGNQEWARDRMSEINEAYEEIQYHRNYGKKLSGEGRDILETIKRMYQGIPEKDRAELDKKLKAYANSEPLKNDMLHGFILLVEHPQISKFIEAYFAIVNALLFLLCFVAFFGVIGFLWVTYTLFRLTFSIIGFVWSLLFGRREKKLPAASSTTTEDIHNKVE